MQPMSHISGAFADSAQDIGGVVALDSPGVVRYPATRSFGNFAWDTMSLAIQSVAANQSSIASVYVPGLFKYRLFFTDGTAISGLPVGDKSFEWSVINYGRNIVYAINDEIAGVARTFYQDDQGWVYEADVGRSFAGDSIPYAMVLHYLTQKSPQVEKGYKQMQLEVTPKSACTLQTSVQFYDGTGPTTTQSLPIYGSGLTWDLSSYDASYWDTLETARKAVPCEGAGTAIAITVAGDSANELTHTLHAASVLYTTRKIAR